MYFPLHLHSEYSFLESGILLEKLFDFLKSNNVTYVALTDKNVLIGFPKFSKLAKKYDIKPIFGMDLTLDEEIFTLLIQNEEGYKNLIKLSLLVNQNCLTLNDLKANSNGLVIILNSASPLFSNIDDEFKRKIFNISKGFNVDNFYIGLEFCDNNKIPHYELIRNFLEHFAYKTIANPLIKYFKKEDAVVLDILNAIKNNTKLDINYLPNISCYHIRNNDELKKFYSLSELNEISNVVSKIDFNFDQKRGEMLHYPLEDEDSNSSKELVIKIKEGLVKRNISLEDNEVYRNRLNYEYSVIKKMGYCDYFLIVQDYVNFAKNNNISVGPGRGSAAGSLISYVLNITDVDPIKYHLLFERFLNPMRQSMPDIDIDFSDTKRGLVIDYLKNKYGQDRVANILTVQTFGAKQSLRDLGRIYDLRDSDISYLTKLIVEKNNQQVKLIDVYNKNPKFKTEIEDDSKLKTIFERALLIEGLGRQKGINAAGIVLNNTSLSNSIPLFKEEFGLITQFEKDYLEDEGFLKMDILGLINLTTIDNCIQLIKKNQKVDVDIKNIDLNNPKIYEPIKNDLTIGLFQLDTSAASSALDSFKPQNFNELTAFISLDRPGPRINLDAFSRRLNKKEKVTYLDNALIPALKDTYGIFIYQEQIMIASQDFAGFSFAEADNLRKACAKKIKSKMDEMKSKFITGALKKGHKIQTINAVYNLISKFAEYGFNKSHAVAYAMITAQTLYLKTYYPLEFYASILDSQISKNDEKLSKYISELKKVGIALKCPDINISRNSYVIKNNNIYMPFDAVSTISGNLPRLIVEERDKNGYFKDFFDFVCRMSAEDNKISEAQVSKLIDAGTFDSLMNNRQSLKKTTPRAFEMAVFGRNGPSLFDEGFSPYYDEAEDNLDIRLELEKQVLGVILSDSPFRKYLNKKNLEDLKLKNFDELKENQTANLLVLFISARKIETKNGKSMCFLNVADEYRNIDVTVFSNTYENNIMIINSLKKNDGIIINGKLSRNYKNDRLSFVLNSIEKIEV